MLILVIYKERYYTVKTLFIGENFDKQILMFKYCSNCKERKYMLPIL